uniref:SnoaL-like domain-containing protein n=1 Tax=Tetradesmus obliquus TaxID=3088 RepID=A0A383W4Q2_TETOB|eukprot:jgi/Sobl393_1/3335/SZX72451.1
MQISRGHALVLVTTVAAAALSVWLGLVQAQGSNHWGSKSKDCSMSNKRAAYLLKLWDGHVATEFTEKSADAAVATMIPEATVNHVPVITGGAGKDALRAFYHDNFISKMPGDVSLVPLERTVGKDANGVETVVDEFIFKFTHSIKMDWMLPGIEPTGKQVSVPFIVVVKFKGDKLSAERIYWDQATVLSQIGVLQPTTQATTGGDQAKKMADFGSVPSNGLINAAAQG